MKKLVAIVLTVLLAVSALACAAPVTPAEPIPAATQPESSSEATTSAEASDPERRLTITFVPPMVAHPTFLIAKEAFEQAAKDLNFEPQWVGPTSIDVNEMVKQIELAIASKVDGIITMATSPEAMAPVLQEAADAGIPVVMIIADCKDAPRLAYLGLDNENFGKQSVAKALEGLNGRKPVVAAMVPTFENQSGIEITAAEKKALEENGEFEWVITEESQSDMVTAVSKWEDILTTYPEVNTIFCVGSECGPAAATVMKEKGLTGEDIIVIGISDIAESLDGIRDGYIYASMSENIPRCGYQPAEWICNYVRYGTKPELINDTGTFPITKENVESYRDIENDRTNWK